MRSYQTYLRHISHFPSLFGVRVGIPSLFFWEDEKETPHFSLWEKGFNTRKALYFSSIMHFRRTAILSALCAASVHAFTWVFIVHRPRFSMCNASTNPFCKLDTAMGTCTEIFIKPYLEIGQKEVWAMLHCFFSRCQRERQCGDKIFLAKIFFYFRVDHEMHTCCVDPTYLMVHFFPLQIFFSCNTSLLCSFQPFHTGNCFCSISNSESCCKV